MYLTKSILEDIREGVGLSFDDTSFDTELTMYINTAIGKLNQNGIGRFLVVQNDEQTWEDLQDPLQTEGNKYFQMVPQFIKLDTKLLFDPPPPSNVQYHSSSIDQLLWRLKFAYEVPDVQLITTEE